jgi:1-phosphatidylinositol-3-phosphate 5-kinase
MFKLASVPSYDETISSSNDQSLSEDSESYKQLKSEQKLPSEDATNVMKFIVDAREGRSLPNVLKRISNIVALKSNVSNIFLFFFVY